jgi:DNA segregation ATPase FtsK/SpoIIIE-like protein
VAFEETIKSMSWRFSRRVQVFPGVKINFSTRGVSTTFGIPGASINIGPKGVYANTGIPGTGLHSRTRLDSPQGKQSDPSHRHPSVHPVEPDIYLPPSIGSIKSSDNNSITSHGLVAHLGQEFQIIAEQKTKEMNVAYATLTSVRGDEPPRGSTPNQPNPPGDGAEDDLFSAAVQIVTDMGRASTSVLQRRLSIGYGRAAKLLDLMEQCGFVAPSQGSMPRKVTQAAYDYRSRMGK